MAEVFVTVQENYYPETRVQDDAIHSDIISVDYHIEGADIAIREAIEKVEMAMGEDEENYKWAEDPDHDWFVVHSFEVGVRVPESQKVIKTVG